MSGIALLCAGLVKRFGELNAVNGLDMEVARGECFGLLGPNGAGKTTSLEIFEGLLAPTSGVVELLGKSWQRNAPQLRQEIGLVFQHTSLPDKLTVREIVSLFRSFHRYGDDVDVVVDRLSLAEKRDAMYGHLSGGQRQRVAMACALVSHPQLLFLDEPTTGLDPQSRRMLWDVVADYKAAGGSVVLTTHYMEEAERLCDRVGVMDRGRLIALGTPTKLIESFGGDQVVELSLAREDEALARRAAELLSGAAGIHAVRSQASKLVLTSTELHVALPAVLETLRGGGIALSGIATHQASLEDVFVELTGRALRD
jgi:ABC-2 type transport system ATP-binding protein